MKDYKKCDTCKQYHWTDKDCDPEYKVYFEEYLGDDPKPIRATNHEDAALLFAQYYNTRNDYCLMNEEIEVRVEFEGVTKLFKVGAEPDVHYSSKELTDPR